VREALRAARERRQIQAVLADAGYDAEWVHQFIRDELDMRSFIPPTAGRPTDKPPAGRYRRAMRTYFRRPKQRRRYGQRWQVETVFSMIKRRLGECVNACSDRRQRRAMLLKAIVHNILILLLIRPFLQSSCVPVSIPDPSSPLRSPFRSLRPNELRPTIMTSNRPLKGWGRRGGCPAGQIRKSPPVFEAAW
jgi:hypothetical protein